MSKEDKRYQSGLVSEARPIREKDLSQAEHDLIKDTADPWIKAVVEDSGFDKPAANEIDERRTGRVLFIDGPRGAGKTSFLLTLIKRWTAKRKHASAYGHGPCNSRLRVFLPVLDFDPLPPGMPLHGWLLEPWRKRAQKLDAKPGSAAAGIDSTDLTEQFAELFERAVIGWSSAHAEGKGVVDKALAYQARASGWFETTEMWNKFVGGMVCRESKCSDEMCKHDHSLVFVIAIDDVDLQVERLPDLLHAIRLFHHPNVAYVLTGNYEHLRFALGLDYLRRHEHRASHHNQATPWDEIDRHSKRLRDAFLEKALPSHAQLALKPFRLCDVLNFPGLPGETVTEMLDADTLKVLPEEVQKFSLVTARQAQRAVEKLRSRQRDSADSSSEAPATSVSAIDKTLKFIFDLCGANIKDEDKKDRTLGLRLTLRGALTTRLGDVLRSWEGRNRTTVMLAERSRFVLLGPDVDPSDEELAHRALVVQLMVEAQKAKAPALAWEPDAAILATEVQWDSKLSEIKGRALFYWPVLVRPTASEVVRLETVAAAVSSAVEGHTQSSLDAKMVCTWLSTNVSWCHARYAKKDENWLKSDRNAFTSVASELRRLSESSDELELEVKYWVRQLLVMTAPYFGLPEPTARDLHDALASIRAIMPTGEELQKEEKRVVKNAIILPRTDAARLNRDPLDRKDEPSSSDYDNAADDFLSTLQRAEPKHPWWTEWRKGPKAPEPSGALQPSEGSR